MTNLLVAILGGLAVTYLIFVFLTARLLNELNRRLDALEDHADEIAPPYRKSWSGGEKAVGR